MKVTFRVFCVLFSFLGLSHLSVAQNSTYYNPVLSGWHSDPSCTQYEGTFYCVTSSFLSFPGLPIYASNDLINWRLASWAWNRESQIPGLSWNTTDQQAGFWAATIRNHDGVFYVICIYRASGSTTGVIFNSTDPFSDDPAAWSDPVRYVPPHTDPDLFWDDDGTVYVATAGINLMTIDLQTGAVSKAVKIWNGTGLYGTDEGPHIYKKDGYYYLLVAEGGTGITHSIVVARSANISGPYEGDPSNPILTARNTNNYFQTVGHGDFFQDTNGNWWGMCLAIRSGPEYQVYPMGRESVLFPVTWDEGEWPIASTVQGEMNGWALPPLNRNVSGNGPFNSDPDVYDFASDSALPQNLVTWRVPQDGAFTTTTEGLQIVPSRANVTGVQTGDAAVELTGQRGTSFIGRRQTHTIFNYTVDLSFSPQQVDQEAGVSVFVTQLTHIDLGVVLLDSNSSGSQLSFRLSGIGRGALPAPQIVPVPSDWANATIRLQIRTLNETYYEFSASPASNESAKIVIGLASGYLISGALGSYAGAVLGTYATCNGAGTGTTCPAGGTAYFTRWRYTGIAQYLSHTEVIAVNAADGLDD